MGQRLTIADGGPPADHGEGSILFVGSASAILRYGGFTILSDPSFLDHGDHVHLGYGLTPRPPGLGIEDLPPIDFVLLSNLHVDRSGRVIEQELDRRLPILTTSRAARTLRQKGFVAARGLASWETVTVERADVEVRVTSVPARHEGEPVDVFLPDLMGSMLEFARPGEAVRLRLYVSGDTLVHGDLREMPRRYPGVDLALFKSPLEDFAAAVRHAGLEAHVHYLARDDSYVLRPDELRAPPAESRESAVPLPG